MNKKRIILIAGFVLLVELVVTVWLLYLHSQTIEVIDNIAFIKAVGNQCRWKLENDCTVRITERNLTAIRDVRSLNVSGMGLTDLSGIEYFHRMNNLDCSDNALTELDDISECTALKELDCSGNSLTELDVSGLSWLIELDCSSNALSVLNISECMALKELNCSGNNLEEFDCSFNGLTKLDMSNC